MSLLDAVRASLDKQARGETLTELDRVLLWEASQTPEHEEAARWKHAFREFQELKKDALLPPVEPVRGGGMKCWHGPDELVCTAMDEGGFGYFEHTHTKTVQRLHMDDVTTRSPYGNFVRLRDASVGATIYWKDSTHWRPLQVTSFQADHVCTLSTRGGNVFIENGHLDRLVSYFPPEWSGPGWSLNPFTRELYIQIPAGVRRAASEHRTRNQKEVEAHVNAMWTIYPGLYYAFEFLKNKPDFVFRVPHSEYTVWTSVGSWAPAYCWTRAQAIPDGAIPACWAHGTCKASRISAPELNCGWYMTPNGVRFTGTNWKMKYGADMVHIVSRKEFRFEDFTVSFENDDELHAFEHAYFTNSSVYTGVAPTKTVRDFEMCAGASGSS